MPHFRTGVPTGGLSVPFLLLWEEAERVPTARPSKPAVDQLCFWRLHRPTVKRKLEPIQGCGSSSCFVLFFFFLLQKSNVHHSFSSLSNNLSTGCVESFTHILYSLNSHTGPHRAVPATPPLYRQETDSERARQLYKDTQASGRSELKSQLYHCLVL